MTDRSNFTPDEWKLIMQSPMMAGIAVSAAEPSGLWGTLKESSRQARSPGPRRIQCHPLVRRWPRALRPRMAKPRATA
jgi:hypothetical protein